MKVYTTQLVAFFYFYFTVGSWCVMSMLETISLRLEYKRVAKKQSRKLDGLPK